MKSKWLRFSEIKNDLIFFLLIGFTITFRHMMRIVWSADHVHVHISLIVDQNYFYLTIMRWSAYLKGTFYEIKTIFGVNSIYVFKFIKDFEPIRRSLMDPIMNIAYIFSILKLYVERTRMRMNFYRKICHIFYVSLPKMTSNFWTNQNPWRHFRPWNITKMAYFFW